MGPRKQTASLDKNKWHSYKPYANAMLVVKVWRSFAPRFLEPAALLRARAMSEDLGLLRARDHTTAI